jgi:hypothetical protein
MTKALSLYESRGEIQPRFGWEEMRQMAETVAKSRLFPMDANQILTLMMLSESEGIHPMRAMMTYDLIPGRPPSLKASVMLGRFQDAGGVVEWVETTNEVAEAIFSHPKSCPAGVRVRYTIDDAKMAALAGKDNWRKNPSDMLVARVITRGIRRALPGVIIGLYDADELPELVAPVSAEGTAHAKLVDKLKARREKPTNGHAAPSPQPEPAPEAEPDPEPDRSRLAQTEPATEWGQWVAEQVEACNVELRKYPVDGKMIRLHPRQLTNHLVKAGIGCGFIVEDFVLIDGKRSPKHCAIALGEAWKDDPSWFMGEVGKYLVEYIEAAAAKCRAINPE